MYFRNLFSLLQLKFKKKPKSYFFFFFSGLVFFQILRIFQGFELCDSGWYSTYYQNIFDAPSTVESNSAYWFTGIIGGAFVKLFPNGGLFSIRLLGVVNFSALIFTTYLFLRKYIGTIPLYLGLTLITLSFVGQPTEFYHNNLSSLLFIFASFSLYSALDKKGYSLFALSGFFLSLNVFTRLPNILDIGIIGIIVIHSYYFKISKMICLKRILYLLFSFTISSLAVLGIMKILGHYDIFIKTLYVLQDISKSTETHGIAKLLRTNFFLYRNVFFSGMGFTFLILAVSLLFSIVYKSASEIYKWILLALTVILFLYFIKEQKTIYILYSIPFLFLSINIYLMQKEIKILSWMALFMMVVMPLGSDGAISNFGNYTLWLSIPLCINLPFSDQLKNYLIKQSILVKTNMFLSFKYFKLLCLVFYFTFISFLLYSDFNKSYFDPGSRLSKTSKIQSEKCKFIFTTPERASIVNDLLIGLKPFVKEGDYLIAYESIPMLYYLTNTKPFLHDSWLVGTGDALFLKKIERVKEEKNKLPLVIRQKFKTIGNFGKPSDEYISDNHLGDKYIGQKQTIIFNRFLKENNYRIIWENLYFVLYSPVISV